MSDDRTAEEELDWVERQLRDARKALWDGKSGKAFASIAGAQESLENYKEKAEVSNDE